MASANFEYAPASYSIAGRNRVAWLTARTHLDALINHPISYLQGVGWRLRGLKLRARHRFAALLGKSPNAYPLWILRDEPSLFGGVLAGGRADRAPIQFLIDVGQGCHDLEASLRSIGGAGGDLQPMLVGKGSSEAAKQLGLRAMRGPAELESDWICLIRSGDQVNRHILSIYGDAISKSSRATIFYGDDDLIDAAGVRSNPHFKPDWNAELFKHHDFLAGACVIRCDRSLPITDPLEWIGSLIASHLKKGARPVRVTHILHHRRTRPAGRRPATAAAVSTDHREPAAVIIPTRNQLGLLKTCLSGVERTAYPIGRTIIVDNGSDDAATLAFLKNFEEGGGTVLHDPGPFNFSALINFAAGNVTERLLCFLNNDIEIECPYWLGHMAIQALRDDVGAVGAKLLYPDRTIQHAGVVTGIGGGAGHAHRFQKEFDIGYFDRANLPQKVSAVTAACLVLERRKFEAVGGFDEINFPVAFNDVDLCLKLRERGWESFYEPRASLIHHESKSRGKDNRGAKRARFATELQALKRVWGTDVSNDPYHHPNLSRFSEQFVIGV